MHLVSPEFIVAVVVGLVIALERYTTLLDRFKKKSPADAAAELSIASTTIQRLRAERNRALEIAAALEKTRSFEPVLAQLEANAELQKQVLDRLVHHNGSFAHMEASMQELVKSLQLLSGFIAGVVELPTRPPQEATHAGPQ